MARGEKEKALDTIKFDIDVLTAKVKLGEAKREGRGYTLGDNLGDDCERGDGVCGIAYIARLKKELLSLWERKEAEEKLLEDLTRRINDIIACYCSSCRKCRRMSRR